MIKHKKLWFAWNNSAKGLHFSAFILFGFSSLVASFFLLSAPNISMYSSDVRSLTPVVFLGDTASSSNGATRMSIKIGLISPAATNRLTIADG